MKKVNSISSQFVIVMLCVIAVMFGSLALLYRWQYLIESDSNSVEYSSNSVNQGDIVVRKDYAMVVTGVKSDRTQIPNYWQLNDDQKFVIVDLSFKNRTISSYSMSPISSMQLVDESGKHYDVTSAVSITNGLGGEVAPQATVRGEVGFTVPNNLNKFEFVFRYKPNTSQLLKTTINLN